MRLVKSQIQFDLNAYLKSKSIPHVSIYAIVIIAIKRKIP